MVTAPSSRLVVGPSHPPPLRFPVDVKVIENDPRMQIAVQGRTVSIKGIASNNGFVPSFAQFDVAGKKINIALNGGMRPEAVLAELRRRLPAGFSVHGTADSFQVMRGGPSKPSSVEQINSIFAKAKLPSSPGKGLITTAELREAFKAGLATGGTLSMAEKTALAQNWASTFTGAGFLATEAAQREYARLAAKYQLPTFPVF